MKHKNLAASRGLAASQVRSQVDVIVLKHRACSQSLRRTEENRAIARCAE